MQSSYFESFSMFTEFAIFEQMMKGNLVSSTSLDKMNNWFDLPSDWVSNDDILGQNQNGFGIERYNTEFGFAVGHTGGIDGFATLAMYFPDKDLTFVLLTNSAGNEDGGNSFENIIREVFDELF